jgi:hypothetical protein
VIQARVIWPAYPYEAGFCVTDDPDASTYHQIRAVYDYLKSKSFVTTKAIWPFNPQEKCGIPAVPDSALRGITLEDGNYLAYCRELCRDGYEFCLHGASAGNNKRNRTQDAFAMFAEHFGPSDTFICHSKNADNMYWEEKTTSLFPFRSLLRLYSKHACSGELPCSQYYWGDLCRSSINQIRLYRTRHRNTLKRNPSMPYYNPRKDLVNGWFSATKRSLADCATEESLEDLKKEHGLTLLYQYLHRYANPETGVLDSRFLRSVDRISSDRGIWVGTVSSIMKRLRQIQGLFVVFQEKSFWLINVSDDDIIDLQILSDHPIVAETRDNNIWSRGLTLTIKTMPKRSVKLIRTSNRIAFYGRNTCQTGGDLHVTYTLPLGVLMINLADHDWHKSDKDLISSGSFLLRTPRSGTGHPLLSVLSGKEELDLLLDQTSLFAREVILKGRSLKIDDYLDSSREIAMENHDNW